MQYPQSAPRVFMVLVARQACALVHLVGMVPLAPFARLALMALLANRLVLMDVVTVHASLLKHVNAQQDSMAVAATRVLLIALVRTVIHASVQLMVFAPRVSLATVHETARLGTMV